MLVSTRRRANAVHGWLDHDRRYVIDYCAWGVGEEFPLPVCRSHAVNHFSFCSCNHSTVYSVYSVVRTANLRLLLIFLR